MTTQVRGASDPRSQARSPPGAAVGVRRRARDRRGLEASADLRGTVPRTQLQQLDADHGQHFAAYNEGRVPEPTPTYVAGFHQWLSLGRSVAKGQHGYGILAPVTGRFASFTPDDPNSWRRLARNEKPDVRRVRPHAA